MSVEWTEGFEAGLARGRAEAFEEAAKAVDMREDEPDTNKEYALGRRHAAKIIRNIAKEGK